MRMPRRGDTKAQNPIALLLCAAVLAGCASGSETALQVPSADELAAAETAGFEVDPVRSAADLVPPDLLTGPHYRIASAGGHLWIRERVCRHLGLRRLRNSWRPDAAHAHP